MGERKVSPLTQREGRRINEYLLSAYYALDLCKPLLLHYSLSLTASSEVIGLDYPVLQMRKLRLGQVE